MLLFHKKAIFELLFEIYNVLLSKKSNILWYGQD